MQMARAWEIEKSIKSSVLNKSFLETNTIILKMPGLEFQTLQVVLNHKFR